MSDPDEFARPEIRMIDNRPALLVDGEHIPPMAFRKCGTDFPSRIARDAANAGFRLFLIAMDCGWRLEDDPDSLPWEKTEEQANNLLVANPDACIILTVFCLPSGKWFDENPDELVLFEDGRRDRFAPHSHGAREDKRQVCLASDKYARDAGERLIKMIDFVESRPFGKRVIGYHVNGGACGEWNYTRNTDDGICGDFSPAFREFYSGWLRDKYGTEEKLQSAWHDNSASFTDPHIPTTDEQVFTERLFEHNGRVDPVGDWGNFLDPDRSQCLIDYYEARCAGTAATIEHLGKVIKQRTRGRLIVGTFWGYVLDVSAQTYAAGGSLFLENSPYIDFLSAPSQYYDRQPGGGSTFRNPVDSSQLRGKLWINECDSRTHLASSENIRQFCGCHTMQDSTDLLKRDFAQVLCDDVHAWWFEMAHNEHAFYDHPDIMALFAKQQALATEYYDSGRGKVSQIAVIYDQDSLWSHPFESTRDLLSWNRCLTLARLGAPCDHIFHDDLDLANLPDYKLYIFLNCHYLSNTERARIADVVKRDGKTALWVYASGLMNPDATPQMSIENMRDLTGFTFGCEAASRPVTFKVVQDDHELLRDVSPRQLYGRMPRPLTSGFGFMGGEIMIMDETPAHPLFYVDDPDAVTLGWFLANDRTAYAVKDFESWRSVYIGAKIIPTSILRAVARAAGVHVYLDGGGIIYPNLKDDIIYANRRFLAIVAAVEDEKVIRLPRRYARITDAYSDEVIATNSDTVTFNMRSGETRMLRLEW